MFKRANVEQKKTQEDDATASFLSALSTTREIKKPFQVKDIQKEKPRTANEYEIVYNPETDANHPYEKWRRNPVLRCMITREIAKYLDRKTYITVSIREVFFYGIFLVLMTVVTFGSTPLDMFYFSQAMTTLYTKQPFQGDNGLPISFYDINTMADVLKYEMSILDKLYHDFWYTKPDPYNMIESKEEFFYENKLIGMPQMRQVRVRNSSCSIQDSMKHLLYNCYGEYSSANEDTNPYGSWYGQYWQYQGANATKSRPIDGTLATYNGGGYVAILKQQSDDTIQTIYQLKTNKWMDRGTRAVFIEFTIYNGNVNLFCIFKLIFEFPPTGGVIPSHLNLIQKLIRYNDSYDFFVLFCECVCIVFFLFFTIQKVLEIKTLKGKLLTSFWSWIDIIILIMCYTVVIFNILLYVIVNSQLPALVEPENEMNYASFDDMSYAHTVYSYSFAILIAFAFTKILKYLNIVHAMYQLQSTVSRAMSDIFTYCVMFFYIYFVFALVGLMLFGNTLEDYKSFPMAVFALMRSSVGDFNYHKLVQADPVLGPIFFFVFIFFVTFILVNGFLAILVSKYEEVRSEVRIGGAKTFIGDMMKYWLVRVLEKAECHWLLSQIERKRFEKKIRSPTEAIRQYLRQAGYSELEIELFFKKYDITDSKISAMDEERISYRSGTREAPPPLSKKDILRYIVIQKLEYLENHYEAANRLIDEFLSKLTKFEGKK